MLQRVADAYGVKLVEGVLTHQMKRFVIDGNKVVLSVPGPDTRVEDAEFEEYEVYAVDVVMSSGEVRTDARVLHLSVLFCVPFQSRVRHNAHIH